jgi:hypothetical protein
MRGPATALALAALPLMMPGPAEAQDPVDEALRRIVSAIDSPLAIVLLAPVRRTLALLRVR